MKRRSLLKTVGISTVAGAAGLSGLASAEISTVDARTMRRLLADNADLLRDLSRKGILDHPGLGQFDLDTHAYPGAEKEGVSKTVATSFGGDRTTPSYVVNREVDDGYVTIRIHPEIDLTTATHRTADGETTLYGARVPGEDGDVSVQCHGGCDYDCLYEVCDGCAGRECDNCCWCEPTCTPGCIC